MNNLGNEYLITNIKDKAIIQEMTYMLIVALLIKKSYNFLANVFVKGLLEQWNGGILGINLYIHLFNYPKLAIMSLCQAVG